MLVFTLPLQVKNKKQKNMKAKAEANSKDSDFRSLTTAIATSSKPLYT